MKFTSIFNITAVTAALTAAITVSALAASPVTVTIDGQQLSTDTPAQIVEGRTVVPMRAIFEALGADIEWNANDKTVTATKEDTVIEMTIGAPSFEKDGKSVALDTPAMVIDSRTMVPVRAVSESLGCQVDWDSYTKTVIINSSADKEKETSTKNSTETTTETTTDSKTEKNTIDLEEVSYADWIIDLSKDIKRPAAIPKSIKNNADVYDLHVATKFNFVQTALPFTLIRNEEFCLEEMSNKEDFYNLMEFIWLESFITTANYSYDNNYDEEYLDSLSDEELSELLSEHAKDTAALMDTAGLHFDDNISLNIIDIDKNNKAAAIAIADDYDPDNTVFVAILYNKAEGFRIYTLENYGNDVYYVCETTGDSHSSYLIGIGTDDGDFGDALTTPKDFLYLVSLIEENDIKPSITTTYNMD